jgi:5,10-methylenetetrahydromethanopterin reductase
VPDESKAARPALSCAFAPGPDTVAHIQLAESLGYRRAWLYDSPALYFDVWATLALAAERTRRIGLGTAVIVPRLRHLLVTASAIATVASRIPGRFALGVGAGFTGTLTLGEKPMRWMDLIEYVENLRILLRGGRIELNGRTVQLMYDEEYLPVLPLEFPVFFAAEGPKGLAAAREHADGVLTVRATPDGFANLSRMVTGTVLDDGESPSSERVWNAAGHAAAARYHMSYEYGADMSRLPNSLAWRDSIEAIPSDERHLVLHKGHVTTVSDHDARFVPRDAVASLTFTGSATELAKRIEKLGAKGITEVIYQPGGPDIDRELTAFARIWPLLGSSGIS